MVPMKERAVRMPPIRKRGFRENAPMSEM